MQGSTLSGVTSTEKHTLKNNSPCILQPPLGEILIGALLSGNKRNKEKNGLLTKNIFCLK